MRNINYYRLMLALKLVELGLVIGYITALGLHMS
jgi:hypothetical protein